VHVFSRLVVTFMDTLDLHDARKRYHFALPPEDYGRLPFYSALLGELEEDPLALRLLAGVRAEQRNPMLVLAALHLAALRGHPILGPIYEEARHGQLGDAEKAARRVLEVVRETKEIVSDELWRSTQTNEPGRSAVLQAVVADLVKESSVINLIEVGCSAGINLCFDQFPVRAEDDGVPLTLICQDLTPVDRERPLPAVAARIGIDPQPLDLGDIDDRLWLKACLWPEERRRHDRFDAVVAARPAWPTAAVLRGTAAERLTDALTLCDESVTTVVFNTWVAYYFSPDEQREYFNALTDLCLEGNVAWISMESTMVKWPGVELDGAAHVKGASQIVVTRPDSSPQLWGWCHPHGRWLEKITTS